MQLIDMSKQANRILFVDTDAITTMFYSYFLLGNDKENLDKCVVLAKAVNDICAWDLVLFLEPDVDFVQDGTRSEEIESDREKYSNQIKELLNSAGIKYYSITGDYLERFDKSKKLIEEQLGIDTKW